jgi:hypothetical protein
MPQPTTARDQASSDQKLAYLDQLAQSMIGLQSSNQALLARRGYADANETRSIDIQIALNKSDWAKVSAKQILYYTTNVKFNPPTKDDLDNLHAIVRYLDGVLAAQDKADAIIGATERLVSEFAASQA